MRIPDPRGTDSQLALLQGLRDLCNARCSIRAPVTQYSSGLARPQATHHRGAGLLPAGQPFRTPCNQDISQPGRPRFSKLNDAHWPGITGGTRAGRISPDQPAPVSWPASRPPAQEPAAPWRPAPAYASTGEIAAALSSPAGQPATPPLPGADLKATAAAPGGEPCNSTFHAQRFKELATLPFSFPWKPARQRRPQQSFSLWQHVLVSWVAPTATGAWGALLLLTAALGWSAFHITELQSLGQSPDFFPDGSSQTTVGNWKSSSGRAQFPAICAACAFSVMAPRPRKRKPEQVPGMGVRPAFNLDPLGKPARRYANSTRPGEQSSIWAHQPQTHLLHGELKYIT